MCVRERFSVLYISLITQRRIAGDMKEAALAIVVLVACAAAQTYNFSMVDQVTLKYIREKRTFPGASLYVFSTNQSFYYRTYGNYTYPGDFLNIPVRDDTIWDMASCTKVVAATSAVMKLYEWGLIKIDDPLIKYIPEANNNGKD